MPSLINRFAVWGVWASTFAFLFGCGPVPSNGAESDWGFDAAKFEARLFQDWLAQDAKGAAPEFFVDEKSDSKERDLVDRLLTALEKDADFDEENEFVAPAGSKQAVEKLRSRFVDLAADSADGTDPRWRELYADVCKARRARRLAVVVENAPAFVYTKHYVIGASHYAYTEDVTDEAYLDFSVDRKPGGQLCLATFQPDGTLEHEVLVSTAEGTIRDPDVSWDGKRIVFSMRKSFTEDDFHLYEYDIETKKTRQITFGLGVADIEPIYLPNGDFLFCSTRCAQITDCWWTEVSNLYTCDAQGRFLRRVSVDQVTVNYPQIIEDGRVVYTRWDYNDRGQIYPQPLFAMNVDGTGQTEFYGNNSYFPTTVMHARGVPGTGKVIAIASGHHSYQHGKLLMIDRSKGTQENSGATLIAPVRETPAERIDAYGQVGELFQYPYAFDETNFLVAYLPEGRRPNGKWYAVPFGVYWFDPAGNRELLAFDPAISCGQALPLAERSIPTTRVSQVNLKEKTGRYYVQDVYEGPGLAGVERGKIKSLRVVALDFRAAGIRSNSNGGPAGGAMVATPVAGNNGTWDVKKVIGEVPVEADGSAYFEVPALTPVYFQLVDENGDVAQTMRSWSTLQPGETFGCVGCHEPKENIIQNVGAETATTTDALRKGVATPKPLWKPAPGRFADSGFSFVREIQPILDTHCVSCHTGGKKADGTPAPFSLLGNAAFSDPGRAKEMHKAGRTFSEAYMLLTQDGIHKGPRAHYLGIQEGPAMLPPYHAGAAKSRVVTMFRGERDENHRDVKIDDLSLRKIAMWLDLLVPYCGDYLEETELWTPEEHAKYAYYLMKREKMAEIVDANVAKKIKADETGEKPAFEDFEQFEAGGLKAREAFIKAYLERKLPTLAKKTGAENVYRNLALNPNDIQGDAATVESYPHATSNSEYGYQVEFAAKNVIDGNKNNRGHGPAFPSWGPNLRTDLWLDINFGTEVEIDKVVIWVRADFPHDDVWKTATLRFSDGSTEKIELKKTAEPQTFEFSKRRVTSVRLTDLEASFPLKWCGITEMEVWGVSVE